MYASIDYRRTIVTYLYFFLVTRKYTGGGKKNKVCRIFVTVSPVLTKKNRWGNLQEPIVNHRYRTRPWNFLVFLESLRIEWNGTGANDHLWPSFSRVTLYRDLRSVEDRSRISRGSHFVLICGGSRMRSVWRYLEDTRAFRSSEIEVSFNNNWQIIETFASFLYIDVNSTLD